MWFCKSIKRHMGIIDLHNDAITVLALKDFAKHIKKAEKAGVEIVLVSVWTTEMKDPIKTIKRARTIIDVFETHVKLLLHIEDMWFVTEQNIEEVLALKPFSVGLTWNFDNNLAGGALCGGGLSNFGKSVLEKIIESGIEIDLAHLNRRSFDEVSEVLNKQGKRLFCSHTCFDEVCQHPRNLTKEQILKIVDSGGIIGLTLVGEFLIGGNATLEDVYSHIKYFVDNFGDDNLAVGTDFYGTENLPSGLEKYRDFKKLSNYLLKKGLSNSTIDKILHKNAHDYFQRIKCGNRGPNTSWWYGY